MPRLYSHPCEYRKIILADHLYIYIYMGETPPGGHLLSKHFIFPSFIEKWPEKTQIVGVFHVSKLSLLLSAFFCLSFSSLPLLFDILKPKKVPTRWGLWHIYIYIYASCQELPSCRWIFSLGPWQHLLSRLGFAGWRPFCTRQAFQQKVTWQHLRLAQHVCETHKRIAHV